MIERNLGPGLAPDVGFLNGLVYVAWGSERVVGNVKVQDLQVQAFTPQGELFGRLTLSDGFYDSFPRIAGAVLVYKAITETAFPARTFRLDTGGGMAFPPSADGNWPCVVVDPDTVAWQTGGAFEVWLGSISTGRPTRTSLHGAPDGLESVSGGVAVCRKDIRLQDPAVGGYPSYAGDLTVGQYGYGIGVRLDGQAVRWIEGDERNSHPDPRCATDGTNYAVVCWGPSVRLYLGTRAELLALPLAPTDIPVPPDPIPPDPPDPVPPDPPVPVPPDPIPPTPARPYRLHKEHKMADTIVVARGPGGKLARPDNTYTGPWAGQGWRGLVFDGSDKSDARYRFVRRGSLLVSQQTGGAVGCDATIHSGGLNQQFYVKPDGDTGQGWAETWQFYEGNANGAIEAQIEYAPGSGGDEGAFFSYPLAIEVVG